jgi:hypothetical protein
MQHDHEHEYHGVRTPLMLCKLGVNNYKELESDGSLITVPPLNWCR